MRKTCKPRKQSFLDTEQGKRLKCSQKKEKRRIIRNVQEIQSWGGRSRPPQPPATSPLPSKDELIQRIDTFLKEKCLEWIIPSREQSADEINLVDIGKSMKRQLDEIDMSDITHVVIENQISPIASRMKTIQGMLAQYFIMRFDTLSPLHIEFVSSTNKLKLFRRNGEGKQKEKTEKIGDIDTPPKAAASYKENKINSIFYCSQILQKNSILESWRTRLDTKKKDDYADCFLQGLWYFHHKNILSVAEDLKINVL